MSDHDDPHIDIDEVVARFPGAAARITWLAEHDATFRSMCEEYALAKTALAHLHGDGARVFSAEAQDYTAIVADLEREMEEVLANG